MYQKKKIKLRGFISLEAFVACFIVTVIFTQIVTLYAKTQKDMTTCNEWLSFFRLAKEARAKGRKSGEAQINHENVAIVWERNEFGELVAIRCKKGAFSSEAALQEIQKNP